jgi:tetratricopeptide (TPR) repeat protein
VVEVSRDGQREPERRRGEVVQYAGGTLTLELASGRREQIPAAQVQSIQTERVASHSQADRLAAEGHYAQALSKYRQALGQEPRQWMQRRILADMVQCHQLLGQLEQACESFLLLVRHDPLSPWFDRIPLSWSGRAGSEEFRQLARTWLDQADRPVAALLGASWLLSGADRQQASRTLQRLAGHGDQRIASLAAAQLWRTAQPVSSADIVAGWQNRLDQVPWDLRAGPNFMVGTALAHLQRHDEAALVLLKVPILYPQQRELAAEALWAAGESLRSAGPAKEAKNVYRELAGRFPQHPLSAQARQRLQQMAAEK